MTRALTLLLALAMLLAPLGCRPEPEPETDVDADGFSPPEDCDDTDAAVNPAATERCDSLDNNCDGAIDEGVTTAFYPDVDADGVGTDTAPLQACALPTGYAAQKGDCDDSDAERFPGNPESCDQKDNNCDGSIDEGVTETFYQDADEDGVGTAEVPVDACDQPESTSTRDDDCDDDDAQVSPDLEEVCDGKDNDCDQGVDEGSPDADADGLPDCIDACPKDPANDADLDGTCGDVDICPSIADSQSNTDGDALGDACDPCPANNPDDADEDGVCGSILPPDPASVAPPLDPTITTAMPTAVAFLYEGEPPIQQGVAPGTIDEKRVAVITGKVLTRDGGILKGVEVTVLNHPELGFTLTRLDGAYDLAVNGGGAVVLEYRLAGYLTAQRTIQTGWQSFEAAPDVRLVELDLQATEINFTEPLAVAQGSLESDDDGERTATLMFQGGTTATMTLPDGSTETLDRITVRATEYTVGENGPEAMPGVLPPTSGYTYAVELSVDDAIDANATKVSFDKPVWFYLENFLDFPVGGIVPVGYYDRARGIWIPSDNGRIVEVLDEANGRAVLDVDGLHQPASADALADLGITDEELERLAELYEPGQSLWRVGITHFTPWDCNWPFGPPPGAPAPGQGCGAEDAGGDCGGSCASPNRDSSCEVLADPGCGEGQCTVEPEPKPCEQPGSIIECQNQVLGERIPLVGIPGSLNYRSNRTPGWVAGRTLKVPLTGYDPNPDIKRVELEITVGDHVERASYAPAPGLSHTYIWDGKVYGQAWQGGIEATVKIGYVYAGVYRAPRSVGRAFAQYPEGTTITGSRQALEITIRRSWSMGLSYRDNLSGGVGGWTLSLNHVLEPAPNSVLLGTGPIIPNGAIANSIVSTLAVGTSAYGVSVGPDGTVWIADTLAHKIRKLDTKGVLTTIAGTGSAGCVGDGGAALAAQLYYPMDAILDLDGSLLVADTYCHKIRKIGLDGIIYTVAGTGSSGVTGNEGSATSVQLGFPSDLTMSLDGAVVFTESAGTHILRKLTVDGLIQIAAGNGLSGTGGDGGSALNASFVNPSGVDFDEEGNLYINDWGGYVVRRVDSSGIVSTIAGIGSPGFSGDGGPALTAQFAGMQAIVATRGRVHVADDGNYRIRTIFPSGTVLTTVGTGVKGFNGDKRPGNTTQINVYPSYPVQLISMDVDADGALHFSDTGNGRIRVVRPASAVRTPDAEFTMQSQDGSELYLFNAEGRHLETRDALTNALRYSFLYTESGQLQTITDGDGLITTLERDPTGTPTAIVGPYGQRTTFTTDENSYLASVTDPEGNTWSMTYDDNGLLETFTEPNGNATGDPDDFTHIHEYEDDGRLRQDTDPDGGFKRLERTEDNGDYTVAMSTALGRTTSYRVEDVSTGGRQRINTGANGVTSTQIITDADDTSTLPTGMKVKTTLGPDPRWGMMSPIATSTVVTTPLGKQKTTTASRTVTLADATDPLSLLTQTDTTVVNGKTFTSVYDATARTRTDTTPGGRKVITTLDEKGRVTTIAPQGKVPGLNSTEVALLPLQLEYDADGRPESSAHGDRESSIHYYPTGTAQAGFVEYTVDALKLESHFTHDAAGRLETSLLPGDEPGTTRQIGFAHDANGNLTGLTPPEQPEHNMAFTDTNRLEDYLPPDLPDDGANRTHYDYNLDGQLELVTLPDASVIDYQYHASKGQLETITHPDGILQHTYDAITGQLKSIATHEGETVSLTYDGSLVTDHTWTGLVSGTVHFVHNSDFRVESVGVNGGNPIPYQYDSDGLLTAAGGLTRTLDLDTGFPVTTSLGTISDKFEYDAYGEVARYNATASSQSLLSFSYTERDAMGRIVEVTEQIQGTSGLETYTTHYTYTPAGRLEQVDRAGDTWLYTYDANGNRTSYDGPDGSVLPSEIVVDDQDRLTQYGNLSFTYTEDGRLESRSDADSNTSLSYTYDVFSNLLSVDLPDKTIDYVIDGMNRRIGKKVDGQLVQGWLYLNQLEPIAELDGNSNVVSLFVYGTRATVPDSMVRGGKTYRILSDHLGSVRLVVEASSGAVVQRMDYDAWGNVLVDTNPGFQPFGFAGGMYDRDTGLVRFGARDYDPVIGRWTTKDPIGFKGGISTYEYARSSPVDYIDPNGAASVKAVLAAFLPAAATGAGNAIRDVDPYAAAAGTLVGTLAGTATPGPAAPVVSALVSQGVQAGVYAFNKSGLGVDAIELYMDNIYPHAARLGEISYDLLHDPYDPNAASTNTAPQMCPVHPPQSSPAAPQSRVQPDGTVVVDFSP